MISTAHEQLKALPESTIANLNEVTDDPIDAMKLAADLYAMTAYRAERAVAVEAGASPPRARRNRARSTCGYSPSAYGRG